MSSRSAKDQWAELGYAMMPSFAAAEEIKAIKADLEDLKPRLEDLPRSEVYYDELGNPASLKQIQNLHKHCPNIAEFVATKLMPLASEVLQGDVELKNVQYFNKPPRTSQPTPAHQDGYYFMIEPCEAATVWMALEPAEEANGCVWYLPGSHKNGMRPHQPSGVLGFSQKCNDFGERDGDDAQLAMKASPGDVLVHHALTLHGAYTNTTTTQTREAVGAIFYRADVKVNDVAHKEYQRKHHAGLQQKGLI